MTRIGRGFRLLPFVLLMAALLLILKSLGLLLDGGYVFTPSAREDFVASSADSGSDIVGSINAPVEIEQTATEAVPVTAPMIRAGSARQTPASRRSWAQEMFNYPDITSSIAGGKKETSSGKAEPAKTSNETAPPLPVRTSDRRPADAGPLERRAVSPSERAILGRLRKRREDLEARARELDMREALLKAAEKRLQGRASELKQVDERIKIAQDKKDDASEARFKGLVAMYESMKAKDAARILDRLDMKILVSLARQINPRRMADILANMSPEVAERLTMEFASRGKRKEPRNAADLPKIEGRPTPRP